jgi:hypothetical protein
VTGREDSTFLRKDGEWALVDGAPEIVGKRENIFFFAITMRDDVIAIASPRSRDR